MSIMADSYDMMSQSQQMTQPQTQYSQTLQHSPPPAFPSNLWGMLVASYPTADSSSSIPASTSRSGHNGHHTDQSVDIAGKPARVELSWDKLAIRVGRHPRADIVLNGAKISSWHARIYYDEDQKCVKLEDSSSNGTYVRGQKVAKGNVTIVEPGDSIVFGPMSNDFSADFRYVFQGPTSGVSTAKGLEGAEGGGGGLFEAYEVREQIGKGSFASVRKGVQKRTGKLVAIKIIEKARFASNPKNFKMFEREVAIMKSLEHKYCVKCFDVFEDKHRIWIVLEYVDGGDLLDYVMRRKGLNEDETREIARMVCDAVAYLHERGIAHRDLKPENLLLTKGSRPLCKVTDFGLAKMIDEGTMLRTMCGTPTYLAPEVILNGGAARGYGYAVDAWSLGVILYACLTNQTPFDESESTPLPQRMRERRVDFEAVREAGVSDSCVAFLSRLLTSDPKIRMTFKQALKHPWLVNGCMDGSALAPLVSSLPFNTGHEASVPRSVTDDSFIDSQGLAQLRINGTPAKNGTVAAMYGTTPDRSAYDEVATESGDISVNAHSTDETALNGRRHDRIGHASKDTSMGGTSFNHSRSGDNNDESHPDADHGPRSAFSSASDVEDGEGATPPLDRTNLSAMSLDPVTPVASQGPNGTSVPALVPLASVPVAVAEAAVEEGGLPIVTEESGSHNAQSPLVSTSQGKVPGSAKRRRLDDDDESVAQGTEAPRDAGVGVTAHNEAENEDAFVDAETETSVQRHDSKNQGSNVPVNREEEDVEKVRVIEPPLKAARRSSRRSSVRSTTTTATRRRPSGAQDSKTMTPPPRRTRTSTAGQGRTSIGCASSNRTRGRTRTGTPASVASTTADSPRGGDGPDPEPESIQAQGGSPFTGVLTRRRAKAARMA